MDFHESLARSLEAFETPVWAAESILRSELLTHKVLDPCCGRGVLTKAAQDAGYAVQASDVYDWGFEEAVVPVDFLSYEEDLSDTTVFMNPPFSKAVEFVNHARALGARKILAFQRLSWLESGSRQAFWNEYPPVRIYVCGNRATCWRMDLLLKEETTFSGSMLAHAWFVWERGHPASASFGRVYR